MREAEKIEINLFVVDWVYFEGIHICWASCSCIIFAADVIENENTYNKISGPLGSQMFSCSLPG